MSAQVTLSPAAVAVVLGVAVGGFFLWRGAKVAGKAAGAVADAAAGVVSGNNVVTQNQKNADGEKVTAYEGTGILGTMGAATNSASGGWFATAGAALGGWAYEFDSSINGAIDKWLQPAPLDGVKDAYRNSWE